MLWKNYLARTALLSTLFYMPPAISAAENSFSVESFGLPQVAFEALRFRYPDISPDNVELTSPVFFNCHAKSNIAGTSQIDRSNLSCMATVNFDISFADIKHYAYDAKGNCLLYESPQIVSVHIEQSGSSRIHFHAGRDFVGENVECDEDVITHIAESQGRTPETGSPFRVDAARILEIAFSAAIGSHPEIPPENMVYGDGVGLSVTCDTASESDTEDSLDITIGPCSATVMLANESVMLEYRYINGNSCMIGKATDWITVSIDEYGLTETRSSENSGGGRARGVECGESFYNSPLPLIKGADQSE